MNQFQITSRPLSRRSLLELGAATGLVGALAACSNEGRGAQPGGNDQAAQAGVRPTHVAYTEVTPELNGTEWGIPNAFTRYPDNPVQAITEPPGDGKAISVMTYTNTPIPPKLASNQFWQELNKRAGSPIEVNLTPSADYKQKFATSVTGDTLGDLFLVGDVPQVPQMLAAKGVDLTAHLSGDNVKKYPFLANLPEVGWNATIFDGKIYGIPIPRGAISSTVMYSRADVLGKLRLDPDVKSADEFVELCKAATDKRANRFALATAPTQFVRNMYDMPNAWAESGGKLVNQLEHEAQEDALALLASLWKAGYIHPDAFTGQNQDMKTRFSNGTSLLVQDTFSGWQTYLQTKVDPNAKIHIVGPPKHDGSGQGSIWMGGPIIGYVAVGKKAESRVETILKYVNWLSTPFGTQEYLFRKYGLEGVHHTMVDGKPRLNAKGISETQLGLSYQGDGPWTTFLPDDDTSSKDCFEAMKKFVPNALVNPVAGMYSETNVRKGPQINTAMDDATEDIITGRKPVSSWAAAVKKWKTDGGDQIAEELGAALAASK